MVRQDASGRRQIPEIRLAGQYFGLDDLGRTHLLGCEVAARTGAVVIRRSRALLNAWIAAEPRMLHWLLNNARDCMEAAHRRLHKLGCMDSLERVADFVIEMEDRLACGACRAARDGGMPRQGCRQCHHYGGEFVLPLMGADISDYLGVTSETVSRCFGALRQRGLISIRGNKSVRILDRPGITSLLVALSEGTAPSQPPRQHLATRAACR
jgi:CRP-like cAMP-binding protein